MLEEDEQPQKPGLGGIEEGMSIPHRLPTDGPCIRWQDEPNTITVYSDSDWAGCRETRKPISGACFFHGDHLIKAYPKRQANIALSSAEAEYYSMEKAASEGLGLKAMTMD